MSHNDPLDSRLGSASDELRSQLSSAGVPDFTPRPRVAAPVAFIVALLFVGGAFAVSQLRPDTSQVDFVDETEQVTELPDTNDEPDNDEPDNAEDSTDELTDPVDPNSARTTDSLTIAPADVTITIGQDATQPATDRTRPEIGEQRNDPAYGSIVTRLTTAEGRFDRLDTNKRHLSNADGTLLLTHVDDGTDEYINVLDLDTLTSTLRLNLTEEDEAAWHPTDPFVIRHLSGRNANFGSLQLLETNVQTNEQTVLADLTERVQAIFPTATHMISTHGRASVDGQTWAWIIRDDNETEIGAISYDLTTDSIIGSLTDIDPSDDDRDFSPAVSASLANSGPGSWLSTIVSPSGDYIVIEYEEVAIVHDLNFSDYRAIENTGDTADVVALANGGEAYVFTNFNSASEDSGFITSVDLQTFERTRLVDLFDDANTSVQISGTATNTPGWVVVSTFDCKSGSPEPWTCNKVIVIELGGENRVVPLAHTYSCATDSFSIPTASANADLSRIYFTSDSGQCDSEAGEVFEIVVPDELGQVLSGS